MTNRYSGRLRLRTHMMVLAFILVICGLSTFMVYRTLIKHNINEIERFGESMARFVLETVREPLRSGAHYSLQDISIGIRNIGSVVYFDVTDHNDRSYLAGKDSIKGEIFKEFGQLTIDEDTFIMEKEISHKGEFLGSMTLAISAKAYRERTRQVFLEIASAIVLGLTAAGLLASAFIEKLLLMPMDQLADAADSIGDEHFVTLDLDKRKDEIGHLASSFNRMSKTLEARISERTQELSSANLKLQNEIIRRAALERELKETASRDSLTGLLNRQAFEREVRSMDRALPISLILLDLDHFKLINDSYGHLAGDKVLKEVSRLALGHTRGLRAKVCRWGGEEILIALQEPLNKAFSVAEELRKLIERSPNMPVPVVTASFGVIQTNEEESEQEAFDRADRCLYMAKAQGRNRVFSAP